MKYFSIEPEVAGSRGEHHVADRSVHPPLVSHLHHQFDGWLGDEILELFPCHIVTHALAKKLGGLSGFRLAPVEVSYSEQFNEVVPYETRPAELPQWYWLQVVGRPWSDDFFLLPNALLAVSERALHLIAPSARFATVEEVHGPAD